MKLVIAIIQPYKLEEVKQELYAVNVNLITVSEVLGHGRQVGVDEFYRGVKETGNYCARYRWRSRSTMISLSRLSRPLSRALASVKSGTARFLSWICPDAYASVPVKKDPKPSVDGRVKNLDNANVRGNIQLHLIRATTSS